MALDMTTADAALKQHYSDEFMANLVYKDNPLLGLLRKDENFGGKNMPIPVIYGNPQGRSAGFSQAQARAASSQTQVKAFTLTRIKDYAVAQIDNETLKATEGNANAFMEAATMEIDGAINSLTRSLAVSLYRRGWGAIGQIANAVGAGSVITLGTSTTADPDSVTNFEIGQELVFSASESANTLRNSGASLIVTGVDRAAGTVTVNAALNTVTGLAQNDFIFVKGDRQDSATPTRLKVAGLADWLPFTAPTTGDSFFGLDRSVDPSRLSGQRFDGSALPIDEAIYKGAVLCGREGGRPDVCFMNFANYANLELALGDKRRYVELKSIADIAYTAVVINGPKGPIKVIPDQNCQADTAFLLQTDTWKLYSLGKAPGVIDTDGLQMLRQASSDGVEVRYGYYANLGCRAPGFNCNVKLK